MFSTKLLKLCIIFFITQTIFSTLFHGPLHPIKEILNSHMDAKPEVAFKIWHYLHKRTYKIDCDEGKSKFEIFNKNFEIIKKHNSQTEKSYKLGLNNFGHN